MGVNAEDEFAKGCEIWDHEVHFRLAILPMKSVRMLKYGSECIKTKKKVPRPPPLS